MYNLGIVKKTQNNANKSLINNVYFSEAQKNQHTQKNIKEKIKYVLTLIKSLIIYLKLTIV